MLRPPLAMPMHFPEAADTSWETELKLKTSAPEPDASASMHPSARNPVPSATRHSSTPSPELETSIEGPGRVKAERTFMPKKPQALATALRRRYFSLPVECRT